MVEVGKCGPSVCFQSITVTNDVEKKNVTERLQKEVAILGDMISLADLRARVSNVFGRIEASDPDGKILNAVADAVAPYLVRGKEKDTTDQIVDKMMKAITDNPEIKAKNLSQDRLGKIKEALKVAIEQKDVQYLLRRNPANDSKLTPPITKDTLKGFMDNISQISTYGKALFDEAIALINEYKTKTAELKNKYPEINSAWDANTQGSKVKAALGILRDQSIPNAETGLAGQLTPNTKAKIVDVENKSKCPTDGNNCTDIGSDKPDLDVGRLKCVQKNLQAQLASITVKTATGFRLNPRSLQAVHDRSLQNHGAPNISPDNYTYLHERGLVLRPVVWAGLGFSTSPGDQQAMRWGSVNTPGAGMVEAGGALTLTPNISDNYFTALHASGSVAYRAGLGSDKPADIQDGIHSTTGNAGVVATWQRLRPAGLTFLPSGAVSYNYFTHTRASLGTPANPNEQSHNFRIGGEVIGLGPVSAEAGLQHTWATANGLSLSRDRRSFGLRLRIPFTVNGDATSLVLSGGPALGISNMASATTGKPQLDKSDLGFYGTVGMRTPIFTIRGDFMRLPSQRYHNADAEYGGNLEIPAGKTTGYLGFRRRDINLHIDSGRQYLGTVGWDFPSNSTGLIFNINAYAGHEKVTPDSSSGLPELGGWMGGAGVRVSWGAAGDQNRYGSNITDDGRTLYDYTGYHGPRSVPSGTVPSAAITHQRVLRWNRDNTLNPADSSLIRASGNAADAYHYWALAAMFKSGFDYDESKLTDIPGDITLLELSERVDGVTPSGAQRQVLPPDIDVASYGYVPDGKYTVELGDVAPIAFFVGGMDYNTAARTGKTGDYITELHQISPLKMYVDNICFARRQMINNKVNGAAGVKDSNKGSMIARVLFDSLFDASDMLLSDAKLKDINWQVMKYFYGNKQGFNNQDFLKELRLEMDGQAVGPAVMAFTRYMLLLSAYASGVNIADPQVSGAIAGAPINGQLVDIIVAFVYKMQQGNNLGSVSAQIEIRLALEAVPGDDPNFTQFNAKYTKVWQALQMPGGYINANGQILPKYDGQTDIEWPADVILTDGEKTRINDGFKAAYLGQNMPTADEFRQMLATAQQQAPAPGQPGAPVAPGTPGAPAPGTPGAPVAPGTPGTQPTPVPGSPTAGPSVPTGNVAALQPNYQAWMPAFRKTLSDGSAIIIDPSQQNKAVSEGFGYGLMLALKFNDRAGFDAIYKGYQNSTKGRADGLSAWLLDDKGAVKDQTNAIDADIDTAISLIDAAKKWNEPKYLEEAKKIIAKIGDKALVKAGNKTYMMPSSDANRFQKGADLVVNPSYFDVAAFREFAKLDAAHDWNGVVTSSLEVIEKSVDQFGFAPDWVGVHADGSVFELTKDYCNTKNLFSPNQRVHIFGNDAVRVLWNLALDSDPRAKTILNKILAKNPNPADTKVADAWSPNAWHNEIAASAFALAAVKAGHPKANEYTAEFAKFKQTGYFGSSGYPAAANMYYNQSLTLLMASEM